MTTKREQTAFSIEVGPAVYTVKKVGDLHGDQGQYYGECQYLNKEILLREGMQKKQEAQTLLHELLHAIMAEYCIRRAIDMDNEEEEVIVDLVALGLTQSLASSPQLMKYLSKNLS